MTLLRSEYQIANDLRIVTHEIQSSYSGPAPLIHVTKELSSLLLDQKLLHDTLLSRRYTIHGAEIGIVPNDIFAKFIPLGPILGQFAKNFGLFETLETNKCTLIMPLTEDSIDIYDLISDPGEFAEEALFIKNLNLTDKTILATHRTRDMTLDSHKNVAILFSYYIRRLSQCLNQKSFQLEKLVDKINECSTELVKKSTYYPAQASRLRIELINSQSHIGRNLGLTINPHESDLNHHASISKVILRGSHLIRSILHRSGLYTRRSTHVNTELDKFLEVCRSTKIFQPYDLSERSLNLDTIIKFLDNTIRFYLI